MREVAEGQLLARDQANRLPAGGFDGMIKQEYAKGEISGIRLFISLPEAIVESITNELDELQEEEENVAFDAA